MIPKALRKHARWVIASSLATVLLVGGVAFAVGTIPGPDGVIHGCFNNRTGDLRVINPTTNSCGERESTLFWNQEGPPGVDGTDGTNGLPGEPGTDGTNGTDGQNGAPGQDGSDGASAIMGRFEAFVTSNPSAPAPVTDSPPIGTSPNHTIVAQDLAIKLNVLSAGVNEAPGLTGGVEIVLYDDGAPTAVSCTLTWTFSSGGHPVQSCNSGTASAAIAPGSDLSFRTSLHGTQFTHLRLNVRFGWLATTP